MSKRLKVYFACAIRGEQGGKEEKKLVVDVLKDLGHEVLSEMFAELDINNNQLRTMTPEQIYQQDMGWLEASDIVVADVSRISIGVGYEMGWKLGTGGRVLGLCKEERYGALSNMIKGCTDKNF